MTKRRKSVCYIVLTIASMLSVFPIYWMFVSATNTTAEIITGKLLPGTHLRENMENLLAAKHIGRAMLNSFRYSIVQTILALLVSSIAGYGFEIYHSRGKDWTMKFLMLSMLVPSISTVIPLYSMFSSMGLLNSMIAFVLPGISSVFLIMLFRQGARAFPVEIIQAARVDGLNEIQIFFQMFIPVMAPTYVAALTITFMNSWNSYMWPSIIMLSNDSVTMPLLIANLMSGYTQDYGMVLLAVSICTIPTIIIFTFLQRYFTAGITGSVKM